MINLKQYGYRETESFSNDLLLGRIIEMQRDQFMVITKHGECNAVIKGSFYHSIAMRDEFPCVGDFVLLQYNDSGPSLIIKLLPRHSKFSRADFSGHSVNYVKTVLEQVIAANFDYVFIVSSLNQDFNSKRILRYLTQAWQSGAQPVVILTKSDLMEEFSNIVAELKVIIPDVPIHAVSSYSGAGLDSLSEYMQPEKTIVFLGMSGVGKSSLLNSLMGKDVMEVKSIREDDSRGRHTTTHRQLFMLPSGAMVIDTPGMRELGLFDADTGIHMNFSDVEELFTQCRFRDCKHESEPGCAVHAAIANGILPQKQWEHYLTQTKENRFVDDKSGYLSEKKEWHKTISKFSKELKKSKKHGGMR